MIILSRYGTYVNRYFVTKYHTQGSK
jgi:hypothetical protein